MNNRLEIDETFCKGCALCVQVCPHHLLQMSDRINEYGFMPVEITSLNLAKCTACALCARMCPDTAISVYKAEAGKGE